MGKASTPNAALPKRGTALIPEVRWYTWVKLLVPSAASFFVCVVRETSRLVYLRLFRSRSASGTWAGPLPASLEQASLWTDLLGPTRRVVRASLADVEAKDSSVTDCFKVKLSLESGGTLPVFVKTEATDLAMMLIMSGTNSYRNEQAGYAAFAASEPAERAAGDMSGPHRSLVLNGPEVLHCAGDRDRFTMVMADASKYARFRTAEEGYISVAEAEAVMCRLARLHARFWQACPDTVWREGHGPVPMRAFHHWLLAGALRRRFGKQLPADHLDELLATGLRALHHRTALLEAYHEGPLTMIHGDAHPGNVVWWRRADGSLPEAPTVDDVGMIDLQLVAHEQGVHDVAYCLIMGVSPEDLAAGGEQGLLRCYRQALTTELAAEEARRGVARGTLVLPSWDEMWLQHRLRAITIVHLGFILPLAVKDPALSAEVLRRMACAVSRLDPLGALAALLRVRATGSTSPVADTARALASLQSS